MVGALTCRGLWMILRCGEAEPASTFVKASSFEPHTMRSINFGKIPKAKSASFFHTLHPIGPLEGLKTPGY